MTLPRTPTKPTQGKVDMAEYKLPTLRKFRTMERQHFDRIHEEAKLINGDVDHTKALDLLDMAQQRYDAIRAYDMKIIDHTDIKERDIDNEVQICGEFSRTALQCLARLRRLATSPRISDRESHSQGSAPSITQTIQTPSTVLGFAPQLDVSPECFDGSRLQYRSFIAQFKNWIARRTTASDTDRLIALRKLLRGEAKSLIDSLEVKDTNFSIALDLLEENFGKIDIERNQIMATLMCPPKIKSAHDTETLRLFLNKVQASIKTMEALDCPLKSYALAFGPVVRAAIPANLIFDYTEQKRLISTMQETVSGEGTSPKLDHAETEARDISELIQFISRYTCSRETVGLTGSHEHPAQNQNRDRFRQKVSRHDGQFQTRSTVGGILTCPKKGTNFRPCLFCKTDEHSSSRCSASLSKQQRLKILTEQRRCERCFRSQHKDPTECRGPYSPCRKCHSKEHYTSMHFDRNEKPLKETAAAATRCSSQRTSVDDTCRSLLFTASAYLNQSGARIPIRIFLDPGSSLTFVTPATLKFLPGIAPLHKANLSIQGFSSCHEISSSRYRISVEDTYDGSTKIDLFAYAHEFGVNPANDCSLHAKKALKEFSLHHHLADRSLLGELPSLTPSLLVGIDQFYKIAFIGREEIIVDGLIAKETRFGWIVGGPTSTPLKAEVACIQAHCCTAAVSKSAKELEKLWTLETIGITDSTEGKLSAEDESAMNQFHDGLIYNGSEYTVSIPKRDNISQLSNNKQLAMKRLESKLKSLLRNPPTYERYDKEIMTFLVENNAEEVKDFEIATPDERDGSFYMPHHQVITKGSTEEKWRIVFDCSASAQEERSLNSFLLTGPNLNPDLVEVLLNFRLHDVALSADIRKAYMCIGIAKEDRPLFRFLWKGPSDSKIRCFQMKKVTWGAAPSGFLLAATLRELFKRADPENLYRLGDSLYHDDMLRSFPTPSATTQFIDKMVKWLGSANMELAKWKTNSEDVARYIRSLGPAGVDLNPNEGDILKVLGIQWAPSDDEFRFLINKEIPQIIEDKPLTKREVLRIVASLFDPMGWLAPFVLRGRMIIQQLWKQNLKWDDPIEKSIATTFQRWIKETQTLQKLKIPRLYGVRTQQATKFHLHIFGDASTRSYACAAYMQCISADGSSQVSLIIAKSRLAPLATMSLPRLELLAALMASRLKRFLCEKIAANIDRVFSYTDSMITYHWATADQPNRYKTFVANRVAEIQRNSLSSEWFFVPGEENVADFATRGVSADELIANNRWFKGPNWLTLPIENRMATQPRSIPDETSEEVKKEICAVTAPVIEFQSLVDLNRHSTLGRAVRVMANIFRFVHIVRNRSLPSTMELLAQAENHIIRVTQEKHFSTEIRAMKDSDQLPRNSKLAAFRLFIDENGLLRAQTRLTEGPYFSHDEKNPIVIPGESRLAALLIQHQHRINAHFGVNTVLSGLRKRFWVTRGRQIVKSLLHKCVTCRKKHGAHGEQLTAPLPRERISLLTPFFSTGLDYCGPFFTRTGGNTVKNYIALFTCAATRAVHLELVPAMSTPQTQLAIRRFISIYPGCREFITDNGRSFVKAASEFKKLANRMKDPDIRQLLEKHKIEWRFICPRAPFHGGFYERLVGSVKTSLVKTLGKSLISFEELRTIITELAAVINERPLTTENADPEEARAITPAHLIRAGPPSTALCAITPLDRLGPDGTTATKEDLNSAVTQKTNYFRAISVRWYREYLLQLKSANLCEDRKPRPIKEGDVCLLKDDNLPRIKWNLVRIMGCHPGRDDAIRTFTVRFPNGNTSRRAAQLLYPLEIV